jgi:hypothetical protein
MGRDELAQVQLLTSVVDVDPELNFLQRRSLEALHE